MIIPHLRSRSTSWAFSLGALLGLAIGCSNDGSGVLSRMDGGGDGAGTDSRALTMGDALGDAQVDMPSGSWRDAPGTGGVPSDGGPPLPGTGGVPVEDAGMDGGGLRDGTLPSGGTVATGGSGGAGDAGAAEVRTGGIPAEDAAMDSAVKLDTVPRDTRPTPDAPSDTVVDVATTDAACGALGEPCCARETCTAAGTVCARGGSGANTCAACGGEAQPCCEGEVCTASGTTCQGGGPRGGGTCR